MAPQKRPAASSGATQFDDGAKVVFTSKRRHIEDKSCEWVRLYVEGRERFQLDEAFDIDRAYADQDTWERRLGIDK
eukprot:CAMPEP_0169139394 /NCGR_PEP_ID=MMETSP1015-20121227/42937_1 /TAXON_ID=342587 /ORGANISM="Karlodinium micrum, Strain CCMP2283" /LENGTH=75 /DNA_ID=CAMNT_0009205079 /DNA_START=37 /DNA_END=264 /DNA_ORIENTATION=-